MVSPRLPSSYGIDEKPLERIRPLNVPLNGTRGLEELDGLERGARLIDI